LFVLDLIDFFLVGGGVFQHPFGSNWLRFLYSNSERRFCAVYLWNAVKQVAHSILTKA
jgi:hypothetical protein